MATSGQDFTTYQPTLAPPYDPAQHAPGPLIATPRGIPCTGRVAREPESSDSDVISCPTRQDMAYGTHARLTIGTRVLEYIPSPPDIATLP
jgi:hypothetical protein